MSTETGFSYVARRKPCGCMIAAIADDPNQTGAIARRTGEWILAGYTVEHVSDDVVRKEYGVKCPHNNLPKTQFIFE